MSVAGQRVRLKDDAYYTPQWCVNALLSEAPTPRNLPILDPCAGDGAILRAFAARGLDPDPAFVEALGDRYKPRPRALYANEIRAEERDGLVELCGPDNVATVDALDLVLDDASAVVTNPPFSIAEEIVRSFVVGAALHVPYAAFLLRMNWLAPQKRNSFARRYPPSCVVVLPRRPCFAHYCTKRPKTKEKVCGAIYPKSYTGPCPVEDCPGVVKAQTDAADYAWHVWERREGFSRTFTRLVYADLEACQ